jgi:hypothetical protein
VVETAHHQQRRDERRFAADAVAEVTEQERADRPRDERDAERDERRQRLRGRRAMRKEHRADNERGGCRIDVEIVELDRGADKAREDDPRAAV